MNAAKVTKKPAIPKDEPVFDTFKLSESDILTYPK